MHSGFCTVVSRFHAQIYSCVSTFGIKFICKYLHVFFSCTHFTFVHVDCGL
jgi:hypothetical protein